MLSSRLARLRETVMQRHGSWGATQSPYLPDVALWRGMRPGQSSVERRAAGLRARCC